MKSKITIKGSKRAGYILTIKDKHSEQDIAITNEEIPIIIKKLKKYEERKPKNTR